MTISSRTPEGESKRCPLCGADARIEFSRDFADATCPQCGCLLRRSPGRWTSVKQEIGQAIGRNLDEVPDALLDDVEAKFRREFKGQFPDLEAGVRFVVCCFLREIGEMEREP